MRSSRTWRLVGNVSDNGTMRAFPNSKGFAVMRVGKPLEHLQAALKALNSSARPGEQITTVLRQLSYASYLIYDAAVWVSTLRLNNLSL